MFCSHTLCLQNARCAGATAEQTQTVTKKSPTIASIPGNCYFSVLFITKLHVVSQFILSLARPLNISLGCRYVKLALLI